MDVNHPVFESYSITIDSDLPSSAYYVIFSQSIELQNHDDFSVRSGAMMSYGNVLLSI